MSWCCIMLDESDRFECGHVSVVLRLAYIHPGAQPIDIKESNKMLMLEDLTREPFFCVN